MVKVVVRVSQGKGRVRVDIGIKVKVRKIPRMMIIIYGYTGEKQWCRASFLTNCESNLTICIFIDKKCAFF